MAHALRRVSYVTCDAAHKQVAFLAREPSGEANSQYCHVFVTITSFQASCVHADPHRILISFTMQPF